ncbi:MAG: hypothetical protein U1E76_24195 [Planctomycetota bacterium]
MIEPRAIAHRQLQRALFRMQLDPGFAAALRRGEPAAVASSGLAAAELELIAAADPAGISADHQGQRRLQVLGNIAKEFVLSVCLGPDGNGGDQFLQGFTSSPWFHAAIAHDTSLPLAFADYASSLAASAGEPVFSELVLLEAAMARARRDRTPARELPPDTVTLSSSVRLVVVRTGAFACAADLRAALDRGAPAPPVPNAIGRAPRSETVLVAGASPPQLRCAGCPAQRSCARSPAQRSSRGQRRAPERRGGGVPDARAGAAVLRRARGAGARPRCAPGRARAAGGRSRDRWRLDQGVMEAAWTA